MVSDFFYPGAGGVEAHVYALSQLLLEAGHDVTVLTRAHEESRGRERANGEATEALEQKGARTRTGPYGSEPRAEGGGKGREEGRAHGGRGAPLRADAFSGKGPPSPVGASPSGKDPPSPAGACPSGGASLPHLSQAGRDASPPAVSSPALSPPPSPGPLPSSPGSFSPPSPPLPSPSPRPGVSYLPNGLRVIYARRRGLFSGACAPTVLFGAALAARVLLALRIELVHAHQALSPLAHEASLAARCLGVPVVFTDHSLFGFADVGSIAANKALKFSLAGLRHAICVSHTSRENTVLRAGLAPGHVAVIPNAVDSTRFPPKDAFEIRNSNGTHRSPSKDASSTRRSTDDERRGRRRKSSPNAVRAFMNLESACSFEDETPSCLETPRSLHIARESMKTHSERSEAREQAQSAEPCLERPEDAFGAFRNPSHAPFPKPRSARAHGAPAPSFPLSFPPPPFSSRITIVVLCRLTWRKGADLIAAALPSIVALRPDVDVLIGGDGPRARAVQQAADRCNERFGRPERGRRDADGAAESAGAKRGPLETASASSSSYGASISPTSPSPNASVPPSLTRGAASQTSGKPSPPSPVAPRRSFPPLSPPSPVTLERSSSPPSPPPTPRVRLVGRVEPRDVPALLRRGDVFLNASLTEAFCIALVEAASSGLVVVSTNVGGVPEVLPPDQAVLVEPTASDLVRGVERALEIVDRDRREIRNELRARRMRRTPHEPLIPAANDPLSSVAEESTSPALSVPYRSPYDRRHAFVEASYSWRDVAARTERVYARALAAPTWPDRLYHRCWDYLRCGPAFGPLCCLLAALVWCVVECVAWTERRALQRRENATRRGLGRRRKRGKDGPSGGPAARSSGPGITVPNVRVRTAPTLVALPGAVANDIADSTVRSSCGRF